MLPPGSARHLRQRRPDTLAASGKTSAGEAKNNISNNFFLAGGVTTAAVAVTGATPADNHARKGYIVAVDGLDQRQCRNLLSKMANDRDYVEVTTSTGQYNSINVNTPLAATALTPGGTTPATGTTVTIGILRSLANPGRLTTFNTKDIRGLLIYTAKMDNASTQPQSGAITAIYLF